MPRISIQTPHPPRSSSSSSKLVPKVSENNIWVSLHRVLVRNKLTKFKVLRLSNGVEYVGRLNNQLSLKEIAGDLKLRESAKIISSRDIVKVSIRDLKPKARDFYEKLVYDQIRNKHRNLLLKNSKKFVARSLDRLKFIQKKQEDLRQVPVLLKL